MNPPLVIIILIIHHKEATVYFWLGIVAGLMVFLSCLFGRYLSLKLSPPPPRHIQRSHQRAAHNQQGENNSHSSGPGPPPPRHTSLSQQARKDTKINMPRTCDGTQTPNYHKEMENMLLKSQQVKLARSDSDDSETNYPWLWVSYQAQSKDNKTKELECSQK